jgi:hypothetical protein
MRGQKTKSAARLQAARQPREHSRLNSKPQKHFWERWRMRVFPANGLRGCSGPDPRMVEWQTRMF